MSYLAQEKGRYFRQKYIMCKNAEAIERMVTSARLRRVKRCCYKVSPANLTGSET